MESVFGPITEHPEFPVEDARRFTIAIKPHEWVYDAAQDFDDDRNTPCIRCGWNKNQAFHIGSVASGQNLAHGLEDFNNSPQNLEVSE